MAPTCTRISFTKCIQQYYTIPDWLNPWIRNHRCRGRTVKLYLDFPLWGGLASLTPKLFPGQLDMQSHVVYRYCISYRFLCNQTRLNLAAEDNKRLSSHHFSGQEARCGLAETFGSGSLKAVGWSCGHLEDQLKVGGSLSKLTHVAVGWRHQLPATRAFP